MPWSFISQLITFCEQYVELKLKTLGHTTWLVLTNWPTHLFVLPESTNTGQKPLVTFVVSIEVVSLTPTIKFCGKFKNFTHWIKWWVPHVSEIIKNYQRPVLQSRILSYLGNWVTWTSLWLLMLQTYPALTLEINQYEITYWPIKLQKIVDPSDVCARTVGGSNVLILPEVCVSHMSISNKYKLPDQILFFHFAAKKDKGNNFVKFLFGFWHHLWMTT